MKARVLLVVAAIVVIGAGGVAVAHEFAGSAAPVKLAAATTTSTTSTTIRVTTTLPLPTTTTTAPGPAYELHWDAAHGCEWDAADFLHARGTIVNNLAFDASFALHAVYIDHAGVRQGDGYAYLNDVHPGQTATWEALLGRAEGTGGNCRMDSVRVR